MPVTRERAIQACEAVYPTGKEKEKGTFLGKLGRLKEATWDSPFINDANEDEVIVAFLLEQLSGELHRNGSSYGHVCGSAPCPHPLPARTHNCMGGGSPSSASFCCHSRAGACVIAFLGVTYACTGAWEFIAISNLSWHH
jgi:hypothetical protein